ncbi:hypothetical protein GWI33_017822 [Rhynchophorus ferrugineus]|uniref:Uncharacterized protein n=1 Tax=Rhynchophorus ferrugineus TaxID=354439 RepID=A0A834HVW8_RHYFE|nr:hypothetical protein GWI33_017822 [Rhynchophorus ferrugineus]
MPKTIDIQGHKFIAALIGYFEKERDNGIPLLPVNSISGRVTAVQNIAEGDDRPIHPYETVVTDVLAAKKLEISVSAYSNSNSFLTFTPQRCQFSHS